jgi:4-amino-4-deoxy-L-arabinose transferase-like glycosyltransferase
MTFGRVNLDKVSIFIKKYTVMLIAICAFLVGQIMYIVGLKTLGIILIVLGIAVLSYFLFFSSVDISKINIRYIISGLSSPPAFALFSIISAFIAMRVIKVNGFLGLIFFIVSGVFLLFAKPADQKILQFSEIPHNTAPVEKWEFIGVGLLTVFVFGVRLWHLGTIPTGIQGHEGTIAAGYGQLKASYIAFIGDGLNWPTLIYYQGIFFADLFGAYVTSYRLPVAIWGGISVIAFYYLARRITSSVTALIFSVVYSVMQIFILFSRTAGVHVVCFLPNVLALSFVLFGMQKPERWWVFIAGGMAAALGLHAYWAGRTMPILFIFWFIWLFIFSRKDMPSIKNQAFFWIGFLIIAWPIIYVAIKRPDLYWGYMDGINPNKSKGILGYISTIFSMIPTYAGMFHIRSDMYWEFKLAYEPVFDVVMQFFFPIGLFMCALTFWKPLNAYLIAAFCAGMLAGILGGNNLQHPTTNRVIMAYPIAALFAAMAFERLRLALNPKNNKRIATVLIIIGAVIGLWSAQNGIYTFFERHMKHPALIAAEHPNGFFASLEAKKHKGMQVVTTHYIMDDNSAASLYFPEAKRVLWPYNFDGFLIMNEMQDYLFALHGHLEAYGQYMKKLFPHADLKDYMVDNLDNPYYGSKIMREAPWYNYQDAFNHYVYLCRVIVPKQDIIDFHGLVDGETGEQAGTMKSDFAEKNSGKKMTLSGAAILDSNINLFNEAQANTFTVKFILPWKNWMLSIDGSRREFGRPINLCRGTHFFTISGSVPGGAKGSLPLKVFSDGLNQNEAGIDVKTEELMSGYKIVGIRKPAGMKYSYILGDKTWDKKPEYVKQSIAPLMDLGYSALPCPISLKSEGWLTVDESGEYTFTGNECVKTVIKVGGVEVYNSINDSKKPSIVKPVMMEKNKRVRYEADYMVYYDHVYGRAYVNYKQGPSDKHAELMPFDWVSPY